MTAVLAQAAGLTLLHWLVIAIIVCAAIGIAMVALKHSGVAVPPAVWTIVWILVVAFVAIVAIKLLVGLI